LTPLDAAPPPQPAITAINPTNATAIQLFPVKLMSTVSGISAKTTPTNQADLPMSLEHVLPAAWPLR
jgi:hypothetical protein